MTMTDRRQFLSIAAIGASAAAFLGWRSPPAEAAEKFEYQLTDAAWRKKLSPDAYAVLRQEATERPYTSPLLKEKRAGSFDCRGCALPLFSSKTKYESNTGWPSFWQPLPNGVGTAEDNSIPMMTRTEVHCRRCGGHLGHVFDDGPKPTGLRYCMNGVAMTFAPTKA